MAAKTFAEKLKERQDLINELSVWRELDEHLSKFMDTDASPTKMGIRSHGEALVVPQTTIGAVRTRLSVKIAEVERAIQQIDSTKVEHEKPAAEKEKEAGEKAAPVGVPAKRKGNPDRN